MKFPEGGQFENPPAGSHLARCVGLVDMGTQLHQFQGHEPWNSRDVRIVFELPACKMRGEFDPEKKGQVFAVSTTQKQSLHQSANLYKLLCGWKGRQMTKDEKAAFDPKSLLGKVCRVNLVANDKGYVNIDSLSPIGPGEKVPPQVNKSVFLSLEEGEFDRAAFDALSDKTKERIAKSPEYQKLCSGDDPGEAPQADGDDVPF